ncbi:hypothetical protein [Kitasatospora sp. NPDC088783]|uniref:hypothetical protein n=1 Tax=Kitasatospora sp. NPDC088783 TaxID=3364077 RepID=UPI0038189A69
MRTSRTYTAHWDLETRQHELLGLDLGEGLPRIALKYAAVMFPLYWGVWLLVIGFPPQPLFPLFLLPPLGATYYGARRSTRYWRRTNLLLWGVRASYLVHGVRPVLGRGRIPPPRLKLRLRTRRLGEQFHTLATLPLFGPAFTTEGADPARSSGRPTHLRPRPRVYGPDHLARLAAKGRRGQARQGA